MKKPVSNFDLKSGAAERILWSHRAPCGKPGCTDLECCCGICSLPVGVSDKDSRWSGHDADCDVCDLCCDQVPVILFRGEGGDMEQAQFHWACFASILTGLSHAAAGGGV